MNKKIILVCLLSFTASLVGCNDKVSSSSSKTDISSSISSSNSASNSLSSSSSWISSSSPIITYTITWRNYDGTLLESDEVEEGKLPSYSKGTPTKESSKDTDYEFLSWSPTVVVASSDATYVATYSESEREYTIVFENFDGTKLEEEHLTYGDNPYYHHDYPTRPADSQYEYEFNGWSPELTVVTSDATYVATYSSEKLGMKYSFSDGSYTVTGYVGDLVNLVVPDTYDDGTNGVGNVVAIKDHAFWMNDTLKTVTLGKNVTSIGNETFRACTSLETVSLNEGLTIIDDSGFNGCTSLKSITLPTSLTTLGSSSFYKCTSLTSMNIPKNVTSIHVAAFGYCNAINGITVDSDNTKYSSSDGILLSKNQTSLIWFPGIKTGSFKIPSSINYISVGAFFGCSLSSIIIPTTTWSMPPSAFQDCHNLSIFLEYESVPSGFNTKWNDDGGTAYWYSETANTDGSHWHYVDGVPTVWAE